LLFSGIFFLCPFIFAAENTPHRTHPFDTGEEFAVQNEIDTLLRESLQRRRIVPAGRCSDAVFIRRVYLDATGTLPAAAEVKTFLAEKGTDKRKKLIDKLLEHQDFTDFQTMRWCDLLRVKSEFPINLWPNGAVCYYQWIHRSVAENKPYDHFVRELLTASGSNFRDGAVNFYRAVPAKDAGTLAETVARTFLGADILSWSDEKQKQLAVFFSRIGYKETAQWKEEIVYWDRKPPDSETVVFPDGTQARLAPDSDPRCAFADWLLSPKNEDFHRTAVNRIWTWLFGSGLIPDPEDSKTPVPPAHQELIRYLCSELVKSKYDLKHLYRLILNSGAYQQSSIPTAPQPDAAALFAAYPVRRIEAEVLQDVLAQIFDLPVGYVSEVPEPFTYIPRRTRTVLLPDAGITSSFLEMFGRSSRDTGTESDRNNNVTESQQLFFLNSTEVNQWVSRYVQQYRNIPRRTDGLRKIQDELWLTFLSRYPTEKEQQIIAEEFRRTDKQVLQKLQDTAWSLLNTKEFLCKH
jgi:hypothetical protein